MNVCLRLGRESGAQLGETRVCCAVNGRPFSAPQSYFANESNRMVADKSAVFRRIAPSEIAYQERCVHRGTREAINEALPPCRKADGVLAPN